MQTIKTFVVIALLIAVCYGAFVALNAPDISIPEELEQWASASGEQLRDEFQVPQFSLPEVAVGQQSIKPWSGGMDGVPSDLPEFPAFDTPSTSGMPLANTGGAKGSLPETPDSKVPESDAGNSIWNLPAVSGAQLTSIPSVNSDRASGVDVDGPAIAFNPSGSIDSTSSPENSAINDLINAGASFLDSSAADGSFSDLNTASTELPSFSTIEPGKTAVGASDDKSARSTMVSASLDPGRSNEKAGELDSLPPLQISKAQALEKAQRGNLASALEMMSQYYENVELDYSEHSDLVDLLDALSREVIYSDRPLLGPAVKVSAQDTLQSLSERHRINPELLAAINKLGDSQAMIPNSQIKVLDGPFRAQISLSRSELTVFLGKMYAGRFPVSISQDNKPPAGTYEIVDRRRDRTFYGTNVVIPATAPTNPFGGYWLSLGGNLSIHGSPEQVTSDLEGAGCISLAPLDAADVYRILGKGSSVEIRP